MIGGRLIFRIGRSRRFREPGREPGIQGVAPESGYSEDKLTQSRHAIRYIRIVVSATAISVAIEMRQLLNERLGLLASTISYTLSH